MHGALSSAGLRSGHRLRLRPALSEDAARSGSHVRLPKPNCSSLVNALPSRDGPQPSEQPALAAADVPGSATAPSTIATTTSDSETQYDPEYLKCKARRQRKYEEEYANLAPEERARRLKITESNTGNTAWNKGRKHSPETIEKIRQRVKQAMQRPEVAAKVAKINQERIGTKMAKPIKEKISKQTKAIKDAMTEEEREELRRQSSERTKALWQDPHYRANVLAALEKRRAATAARAGAKGKGKREETPEQREARLARRREREAVKRAQARQDMTQEDKEQMRLEIVQRARERAKAVWADPETAADRRAKISAAIRAKWADPEYRERTMAGISRAHEPSNISAAWSEEELEAMKKVVEEYPLGTYTWSERWDAFRELLPANDRTQGGLSRKYHALVAAGKLPPPPERPPGAPSTPPRRAPPPHRTNSSRTTSGKAGRRSKGQAAIEASKAALQQMVSRVRELQRMVSLLEDKMAQLRNRADDLANDPAAYSDCLQAMRESEGLLQQARGALARQLALIPPYVQYNSKGVITEIRVPPPSEQTPPAQQQYPSSSQQQQPQRPWHEGQATANLDPYQQHAPPPHSPAQPQYPGMPPSPTTPGPPSSNGIYPPQQPHYYNPHPYWPGTQHPPYPAQQSPFPSTSNNGAYPPGPSTPYPPSTPDHQPGPGATPSSPSDQPWTPQPVAPAYVPVNGWAGHHQVNGYSNGAQHSHQPHVTAGGVAIHWGPSDQSPLQGDGQFGGTGVHWGGSSGQPQQPQQQQQPSQESAQQQQQQPPPPDEGPL